MATEAELRAALEWETGQSPTPDKNVFEWLWEAIQGDFNDDRSTGQVAFDAAVSMIPVVDQICDVRDLIANCRAIANSKEGEDNSWKYVALALTLIGLFPSLGSLVKGVLKIFFLFLRKYGLDKMVKACDDAMTWVITYLRKREVQRLLRRLKVDDVFKWLADQVRALKGRVNTQALLANFDRGIGLMKSLLGKVVDIPYMGPKAKAAIEMVERVRRGADAHLGQALTPVQRMLDAIIHRLELEGMVRRSGILDARNVHFRGTLPQARAVTLMKEANPPPAWLSRKGERRWSPANAEDLQVDLVAPKVKEGWPALQDYNIESFHTLAAVEIKGPAKLFRVVSPSNGAMSDCWVTEDVWQKILASSDPKSAWRRNLAVWPQWNPNGQYVVYEIPAGQSAKVWRGPASTQTLRDLPDHHLEGGWDQVIFKPEDFRFDDFRYYRKEGERLIPTDMTRAQFGKLSAAEQEQYLALREKINQPGITGPLDTGWGSTDFDSQLRDVRLGLPSIPGQLTN